MLVSYTSHFN